MRTAFSLALGLLLPLGFWVCRWLEWPFWWCGFLLLPALLTFHESGGNALVAARLKHLPGVLAVLLGGAALIWRDSLPLLYYPVLVNVFFFLVFAASLGQEQTLIERLARRLEPDLPPSGVRYTRQVTKAWCVFFIVNGSVAAWSIGAGEAIWAFYNGCVAYLLMGLMFAGEWLLRGRMKRRARLEVSRHV